MNSIFAFSACTELCLSYFASSLTTNIFNQALCLPGLLKPYDCGGNVTFFISFAHSLYGKKRKKSWEEWNQVFILSFQRVSVRAELLLCYTLLGLERTSWSRSHIFRSLTHVVWRLQNLSMHSLHLKLHLILHPLVFQDHRSKSNILPPPLSQVTASPFVFGCKQNKKKVEGISPKIHPVVCIDEGGAEGEPVAPLVEKPSSFTPEFDCFSVLHQRSHSCLNLLIIGRCPPVPGADLHASTGLVWGGWVC